MGAALKIFSDFLGTKDSVSDTKVRFRFRVRPGVKGSVWPNPKPEPSPKPHPKPKPKLEPEPEPKPY